ncbi:hypothetical protein QOZ80_2BG0172620 [Eleusine coracana subsp. coracana]|nr:hypothetical protein QOZ80_2BG0172620 [Eleusine coracana subsp. coracana]
MPSRTAVAPVHFPLLDPQGVPRNRDATQGRRATAVAVANTSIGQEVEFWLEVHGGTLVLCTSNLETPDPYDGRLIQSFPEIVCADENLVLFRIRTNHGNFPIDYFVYSFPPPGATAEQPSVVRLPDVAPEMASARSVGILRLRAPCKGKNVSGYVVVNLRIESSPNAVSAFLDRCYSLGKAIEWSQDEVTLHFPKGKKEYIRSFHTDLVIPFDGSLLWIDLWGGILRCPNLLPGRSNQDAMLKYLALPPDLYPALNPSDADHRRDCKPFRTVGRCNGELKLVNLRKNPHDGTVCISIWTLQAHAFDGGWPWSTKITVPVDYPCLWADIKSMPKFHGSLPPWEQHPLRFPVLCLNNSNILYLTVATQNKAWLLRTDMASKDLILRAIADHPGFCGHRNAPYPSNVSKYLHKLAPEHGAT